MPPNWMAAPSEQSNKAAKPTKNLSVEDNGYPTGDIDEIWEPRPVRLRQVPRYDENYRLTFRD